MTGPDDIRAAYTRITPHVRRTPLIRVDARDFGMTLDHPLALKLEFLQHTGSFKPRGAFNNLLSRKVPGAGVAAASGGNHGAAVAYAAQQLGHKATIFVPDVSAPVKIARIKGYGADTRVGGARAMRTRWKPARLSSRRAARFRCTPMTRPRRSPARAQSGSSGRRMRPSSTRRWSRSAAAG